MSNKMHLYRGNLPDGSHCSAFVESLYALSKRSASIVLD